MTKLEQPNHHKLDLRIYYEDTDAGGIVYHASYLRFCERARSEMLRESGCNNAQFVKDTGLMFVVRHIDIHYLKPGRLDDSVSVISWVKKIGGASFILQQNVVRGDDILTEATVTLVCVDEKEPKPASIPQRPREALSQYMSVDK